MPDSDPTIGQKILKQLAILRGVTIVLAVALIAIVVYLFASLGKTNDALCNLRQDLQRRVASSEKFLRAHPHGIPGIRPAFITKSIKDQKRTIDALAPLGCPPPPL